MGAAHTLGAAGCAGAWAVLTAWEPGLPGGGGEVVAQGHVACLRVWLCVVV